MGDEGERESPVISASVLHVCLIRERRLTSCRKWKACFETLFPTSPEHSTAHMFLSTLGGISGAQESNCGGS